MNSSSDGSELPSTKSGPEETEIYYDDDDERPLLGQMWQGAQFYTKKHAIQIIGWLYDWMFSFIGLHYIFIVSWSLLLSFIIYPYKQTSYTDALFHGVSFATGTGLNLIPSNDFPLYQTIFIYIWVVLSMPLVVNSSMVWLRLHLYEQKFDGINQRAKRQSKLRRQATRTATLARMETRRNRSEARPPPEGAVFSLGNKVVPENAVDNESTNSSSNNENVRTYADPQEDLGEVQEKGNQNIAFADLPKPNKSGGIENQDASASRSYNPRDMFRSLNMLQQAYRYDDSDNDEDDGPALVIKSPRDIEADAARGIDSVVFVESNRPPAAMVRRGSRGTMQSGNDVDEQQATGPDPGPQHIRHTDTTVSTGSSSRGSKIRRRRQSMSANYLSWTPTVGANSTFVGLTKEQKDELGGVEYRALKTLLWFIYGYHFGLLLLATILMTPWMAARKHYYDIIRSEGISPAWFGAYTAMASFCNLGFTLSANSFGDFQQSAYLPLWSALFMWLGDLMLPVALRFLIWLAFVLTPPFGQLHESLGFLLDHPRRCFLLLFPSRATWLLFGAVVVLNLSDFLLFIILDVNAPNLAFLPTNYRIMCGFYQSVSSRKSGFTILDLNTLHPAILVVYVFMMYIAVFPLAISIRKTNVYEEQTLGIYYDQNEQGDEVKQDANPLATHMQRQLSHDMWYLFLGVLLLCICEGTLLKDGDVKFFDVLFEAMAGYGNAGMSLGYKGTTTALSAQFNVPGKLIMMALMIRGRHRGLPYRVDRAIILKGEAIERRDTIQQEVARDVQPMAPRSREPESLWLTRVGTAASRLGREATVRLRPSFNRRSSELEPKTAQEIRNDVRRAFSLDPAGLHRPDLSNEA